MMSLAASPPTPTHYAANELGWSDLTGACDGLHHTQCPVEATRIYNNRWHTFLKTYLAKGPSPIGDITRVWFRQELKASNGRQGAGQQVRPPGTEHSPRDDLAANEVQHLHHLVPLSSSRVELLLQLRPRVPAAPFSTGLALSSVDGLRRQGTQGRR